MFVGVILYQTISVSGWSVVSVPVFSIHKGFVGSIDGLVSKSGVGCKWTDYFVNVLAYADDIVVIASSWSGLQRLISLLHVQACSINLTCNVNKTVCV